MINVTKTFLPSFEAYSALIKEAWDKSWITNNGALLLRLERELRQFLGCEHLWMSGNGTIVLQMALHVLGARGGEIITTPFSYVATSNAIAWEGCKPVFADIDPVTYCIDPSKIEALITKDTRAILATHVFGFACDTDAIGEIASRYKLPVIYDGAHAFGVRFKGESLLFYGDISTCSFHATKLFHTVEGGCVIAKDAVISKKLEQARQFGHAADNYYAIGINGKNSEMHAAMGLCLLPLISDLIAERKQLFEIYRSALEGLPLTLQEPGLVPGLEWNYAYFPVLFDTEKQMLAVKQQLEKQDIFPRRYFYPALNTLGFYGETNSCPIAENIAPRILCLPFFNGMQAETIYQVAEIVRKNL